MSKRDDDLGLEATQQLRLVRPAVDRVGMEAMRARTEQALFAAAQPARGGRFVLLDTLATGGMGVVYRAYDPQLDRQVALKVIKPGAYDDRQAREWLLAEARTLARLKHPNIVPIHDVTLVDDQVVMVMELVEGQTLAEWQDAERRTWREIVDVYAAAGRGLAAAHARGLVHRDFKPANVIVGSDGQVRVIDFGLAQVAGAAIEATGADSGATTAVPRAVAAGATPARGVVAGTPAYMAPEQMTGDGPSPAADQFSFCVALHQALFGVRPFAGDNVLDLLTSIRSGRIVEPLGSGGVPAWLRSAVARGLAPDPAARHPSMQALLAQLDRRPARRRRWPVAVALGVVALGAAAFIALDEPARGAAAPPPCASAALELRDAWSPARSDLVRRALLGLGVPSVDEVVDRLDAYGQAWIQAEGGACRAHHAGALSAAGHERTSRCLRRRKADLATVASTLLQVEPGVAIDALGVVALLEPVATCGDEAVLAAEQALPADESARAQVEEVGDLLRTAEVLSVAGRPQQAIGLASSALVYARAAGHRPAIVLAALAKGRLLAFGGDDVGAIAALTVARDLAIAQDPPMREAAVEAAARRLHARIDLGVELAALRPEIEAIEPTSEGLRDGFARPLLLNAIGRAYSAAGDRERAACYFARAHGEIEHDGGERLELTAVDINLALVTADPVARRDLLRGVLDRRAARLAPGHPYVLNAQRKRAAVEHDPMLALPLADEACAALATHATGRVRDRAVCAYLQAFLHAELGATTSSSARYAEVVELARGSTDAEVQALGALAAGHAALAGGRPRDALPHFRAVIASAGEGADAQARAADAHLGAGLALLALRRAGPAIADLESADAGFAATSARTAVAGDHQRLALARLALASALRARGHAGAWPGELERWVGAYYRAVAPVAYRWRLDQLPPPPRS